MQSSIGGVETLIWCILFYDRKASEFSAGFANLKKVDPTKDHPSAKKVEEKKKDMKSILEDKIQAKFGNGDPDAPDVWTDDEETPS